MSVLTAAAWLPWLLIGLPAGAWVDRWPRRPLLLTCNLLSLLLLLSVPLAAGLDVLTIGHLLAVALLTGVASVFFQTAMSVYLPTLVDDEDLTSANAALTGSESVAQVAGPSLAGLIAQTFGAVVGLVADAVSFVVSSVGLLLIRTPEPRPDRSARSTTLRREIAEGLRFVIKDPYLRIFVLFGAVSNIALTGYQAVLVVFLVRDIGVSAGVVGLLISGMSVGGVIGASLAGWLSRRFGSAHGMLAAELLFPPLGLLIPLTRPGLGLICVVVGGVGIGIGIVSGNVIKVSFRQTYTPRPLLGRVVVSMQFLNYGTIPLGALLAGTLGATLGLRPTMWIMAVGIQLASLLLLVGPIRHHRDLPVAPAHAATPVGSA